MKVHELIAALRAYPPQADVLLKIGDPQDTAFTNDVAVEPIVNGTVTLAGWVSSDNEDACAPWSCD